MMPLTAMTAFFATEVVLAALGVLRCPGCVTVTTRAKVGLSLAGDHVNTW
jgi:hypothetical protein